MAGEVTLENHRLNSMLRDPELLQLLPCLDMLVAKKNAQKREQRSCRSCGGGRSYQSIPHASYDQVRRCLAEMLDKSAELRAQVKKKLHADGLRLKYVGTNKIITKKY